MSIVMASFDSESQSSSNMPASPHVQPAIVSANSHIAIPGQLLESNSSTTESPIKLVAFYQLTTITFSCSDYESACLML